MRCAKPLSRSQSIIRACTRVAALVLALAGSDGTLAVSIAQTPKPKQTAPALASPPAPGMLAAFHTRLGDLEAGRRPNVLVLQVGDSHTAADYLTGRLRQALQARFGDGGRGFMAAGVPYRYFRAEQIKMTQTGRWQFLSSNKAQPDAARFGLSGYAARSTTAGDTITIESRAKADTLRIGYIHRPGGGTFDVIANGWSFGLVETGRAGTTTERRFEVWLSLDVAAKFAPGDVQIIDIKMTGDGPVELTDIALTKAHGIQVANVGFIGAQVGIMGRWDWPTVSDQLNDLDPALIIVAFGTNEGFAPPDGIAAGYESLFEQRVKALQQAAPNASLVILGPPDAARYPRYCLPPPPPLAKRQNGTALQTATPEPPMPAAGIDALLVGAIITAWPPSEPPETAICAPLSATERQSYRIMLASKDRALCRWHTPPALAIVREAQRRVAARHGLLFLDWSVMLDGDCGIDRWARQGLAAKDRVHFKQAGYVHVADRILDVLLDGYPAAQRRP